MQLNLIKRKLARLKKNGGKIKIEVYQYATLYAYKDSQSVLHFEKCTNLNIMN